MEGELPRQRGGGRGHVMRNCRKGLLCLLLLGMLAGCGGKPQDLSPTEQVMQAMFTCPNERLFQPDLILYLDLLGDSWPQEMERVREARAENAEVWKEEIGSCFTEEGWEAFVEADYPLRYHAWSEMEEFYMNVEGVEEEQRDGQTVCTVRLRIRLSDGEEISSAVECGFQLEDTQKIREFSILDEWELQNALGMIR